MYAGTMGSIFTDIWDSMLCGQCLAQGGMIMALNASPLPDITQNIIGRFGLGDAMVRNLNTLAIGYLGIVLGGVAWRQLMRKKQLGM